jgi:hypothetical protein
MLTLKRANASRIANVQWSDDDYERFKSSSESTGRDRLARFCANYTGELLAKFFKLSIKIATGRRRFLPNVVRAEFLHQSFVNHASNVHRPNIGLPCDLRLTFSWSAKT